MSAIAETAYLPQENRQVNSVDQGAKPEIQTTHDLSVAADKSLAKTQRTLMFLKYAKYASAGVAVVGILHPVIGLGAVAVYGVAKVTEHVVNRKANNAVAPQSAAKR